MSLLKDCESAFLGSRRHKRFPRLLDYLVAPKLVGYSGWIGQDNKGDESIFLSCQNLLQEIPLLHFSERMPFELAPGVLMSGRRRLYSSMILGGGTLMPGPAFLSDIKRARELEIPYFIFGTGVLAPSFWEKIHPHLYGEGFIQEWVASLNDAELVMVRDPRSADVLTGWGVSRVGVVGDLAMSFPLPPYHSESKGIIGINLGCDDAMWGDQLRVVEEAGKFFFAMSKRGYRFRYISMHPNDTKWMKVLAERGLRDIEYLPWSTNESAIAKELCDIDFLVGQRLHSVIMAHVFGKPAISLAYNTKGLDYFDLLPTDHRAFCIRTDELTTERLLDLSKELPRFPMESLSRAIATYKKLQTECADFILKRLNF